jgi:sugar/nucleoside kinase (ribokinase family)
VGGELVAGGPAANAAVTAARLLGGIAAGGSGGARLVTAIGTGPAAAPVHADLRAHHVAVTDLAPPGWAVPVASALVEVHGGERTVVSPGALGGGGVLTDAALPAPLLDDAAVLLLDGHHPRLAARAAAQANQAGIPILLDAGSWKNEIEPVLPRIGVAACSADFTPPGGPRAGDDPAGVATALHRRGVTTVLVTDGPRPVLWSTIDGERGVVPVPPVTAVDTLGAGDVFHGALAAAIAAGSRSVPAAVGFAVAVAGVRCATLGCRAWLSEPALDEVMSGFGVHRLRRR